VKFFSSVLIFFFLLIHVQSLFAVTVVLKSGKKIEGELISEERTVVRIRANDGMDYSLNMIHIDRDATIAANEAELDGSAAQPKTEEEQKPRRPATLAEAAESARLSRTGKGRTYTEADLINAPDLGMSVSLAAPAPAVAAVPFVIVDLPESKQDLSAWIAEKEKEYKSLKAQCRAAGADPDSRKLFKTDTYIVNGTAVSVSGYWADPDEVAKAKRICRSAMETEAALVHAKNERARLNSLSTP
jgi:hypothetical protein